MDIVSVIVPVYKVEKYLHRCVKSILNQTYKDMEIILVDDGSPDNCGKICEQYARQDKRVKVIHKVNGGLSDARNAGIDIATGDYLTFIDSDDYISEKLVENLVRAAKKSNAFISCTGFVICGEDGLEKSECQKNISYTNYSKAEFLEKMLYQDEIDNSAWGKLYKKELFDNVRYPKGKLYEDLATTYKVLHKADNVSVVHAKDYYYVQQKNSIMHMKFNSSKMDAIHQMQEWYNFIEINYPQQSKAAKSKFISVAFNIWKQIPFDSQYKKEKNLCWDKIRSFRRIVLFDKNARKKNRLGAFCSYFGQHVCAMLIPK